MGIPCPDEVEDNSSRDEGRKRAMLALEGRNVASGFAKVEIPDWVSPTIDSAAFDWEAREYNIPYCILFTMIPPFPPCMLACLPASY